MKTNVKWEPATVTVSFADEIAGKIGPNAKQEIASVMARAKEGVLRALKRSEAPEGFERFEFVQQRGPTIEAWARLLCSDQYETIGREPFIVSVELYQTRGGAYLAVTSGRPADREGWESVRVTVVPPGEDERERCLAVMDAFEWHNCARRMVVRKLKWSLREEVE